MKTIIKYEEYISLKIKEKNRALPMIFNSRINSTLEYCREMFELDLKDIDIFLDKSEEYLFILEKKILIITTGICSDEFSIKVFSIFDIKELVFDYIDHTLFVVSFKINDIKYSIPFENEFTIFGYTFFSNLIKEIKN